MKKAPSPDGKQAAGTVARGNVNASVSAHGKLLPGHASDLGFCVIFGVVCLGATGIAATAAQPLVPSIVALISLGGVFLFARRRLVVPADAEPHGETSALTVRKDGGFEASGHVDDVVRLAETATRLRAETFGRTKIPVAAGRVIGDAMKPQELQEFTEDERAKENAQTLREIEREDLEAFRRAQLAEVTPNHSQLPAEGASQSQPQG